MLLYEPLYCAQTAMAVPLSSAANLGNWASPAPASSIVGVPHCGSVCAESSGKVTLQLPTPRKQYRTPSMRGIFADGRLRCIAGTPRDSLSISQTLPLCVMHHLTSCRAPRDCSNLW